jgi:hypothetical protein
MGFGKMLLIGSFGVSVLGAVAAPFHEADISSGSPVESGKRFLASSCATVTRNRYINGKLGRGQDYCNCLVNSVEGTLHTRDESRYVAKLQSGIGQERSVLQKERITASVIRVRKEYLPKVGASRIAEINRNFFPNAKACTNAM